MQRIQTLIQSIVSRCQVQDPDLHITEPLAAFMVKAVLLDQSSSFQLDKELNDHDVEELIRLCVDRLLVKDNPSLETIKMQVIFHSSSVEAQQLLDAKYDQKETQANALFRQLTAAITTTPLEESYKVVTSYVYEKVIFSVDPQDRTVQREAQSSLESVLPRQELPSLLRMNVRELRPQLDELCDIVLGIRLFNKASGVGSADLQMYHESVPGAIETLMAEIMATRDEARRSGIPVAPRGALALDIRAGFSTSRADFARVGFPLPAPSVLPLRPISLPDRTHALLSGGRYVRACETQLKDVTPASVPTQHVLRLQQELANRRQLLVFLETVLPKFVALAQIWRTLYDARDALDARQHILEAIHMGSPGFTSRSPPSGWRRPWPGNPRRRPPGGAPTEEQMPEVPRAGYCPHALVHSHGLLLPGNVHLGILRWGTVAMACRNREALQDVRARPQWYVEEIVAMARRQPELIHLLDLQTFFPNATLPARPPRISGPNLRQKLRSLLAEPVETTSEACQTPVHFIEQAKDPKYDWNEWSLRRKALQLVQLKNKRTHSTQTMQSHFRRDSETQHYEPKEASTSTAVSTATNPPKLITYMRGLRGDPQQKMNVVTLKLDLLRSSRAFVNLMIRLKSDLELTRWRFPVKLTLTFSPQTL
ncbi:putative Cilia- and flagella-associated protein [Paratrimastix pyriformis]|uniref:Cilia- and flagella-associated protein 206 n=1 Tax=Paratrimastix pyriformis TaxID=342808 RepID=A0ABQ8UH55_9EUKA|nr:putative Cilia- and flagella-associated protein [Paratrimastix pyriformis]